ncbi:LPP20 family lipoprotein [Alishewanella sp. HH-ZS]|uniref:LPP20 family lipoprotein n=1 Tax=Alishewanella sp. HH-ZS TaxID=1856684 RepID=UPI0008236222|nr:LPP20 family lipoprotein [Alishewanella sp. HH-ZS]OCW98218.1 flagellar biosynthesis protein FlgP [Alishewanella sp. HH-ZS]
MNRLGIVLLGGVLVTAGCSQFADRHIEYQHETPVSFPVITALGAAPISLQQGSNETQKMLLAMRASKLEAYRELAERVYGQRIDSQNTVSAMVAKNDILEASVQGLIRGARVVKSYAVDDTYVTELELNFAEVYATLQHTQPKQSIRSVRYLW